MNKKSRTSRRIFNGIADEISPVSPAEPQTQDHCTAALLKAVEERNHEKVSELLASVADLNVQFTESISGEGCGDTSLMRAIRVGDRKIVKLFVEHGCDVNVKNNAGESALEIAWDKFDADILRLLVSKGLNPNVVREFNEGRCIIRQPLIAWAIRNNELELVRELLIRGADPNSMEEGWVESDPTHQFRDDCPLLGVVISTGNELAAKLLLEYGADPNGVYSWELEDPWSMCPMLVLAVREKNVSMVRMLLGRGGNANAIAEAGCWPYDCKIYSVLEEAINVGDPDIVRLLLKHGANPNAPAKVDCEEESRVSLLKGEKPKSVELEYLDPTVLSSAVESGNAEIAEILVEFGATITPFCVKSASLNKDFKLAKFLLLSWTKQHEQQSSLQEMMVASAAGGCLECIERCLHMGAAIDGLDNRGATALSATCEDGDLKIINFLLFNGADIDTRDSKGRTPLMVACSSKRMDVAQLLLMKGADVTLRDSTGKGPLMEACQNNNLDLAKLLLQSGADLEEQDNHETTPLITACKNRLCSQLVDFLVDQGADVNRPDVNGTTPLMHAVFAEATRETIATLIEAGANVNARSEFGRTALMLECERLCHSSRALEDSYDRVEFLIKAGADLSITDNAHKTAWQLMTGRGESWMTLVQRNIFNLVRYGLPNNRDEIGKMLHDGRDRYGQTGKWISALHIRQALYDKPTRKNIQMLEQFETLILNVGRRRLLRNRLDVRNSPSRWIGSISLSWSGISKVLSQMRRYPEVIEFLEWADERLRPRMK